jgi:hypothetical protein
MATPTQTGSRSMARVRPYRESDLAKLQELFHKNYPELVPTLKLSNAPRPPLNMRYTCNDPTHSLIAMGGNLRCLPS